MGKGFGNLGVHIKRVAYYRLSPYELRPFAGYFSKGIPNWWRKFQENIGRIAPRK